MEPVVDQPQESALPPAASEHADFTFAETRTTDAYSAWWALYTRGEWARDAAALSALIQARLVYQEILNALDEDVSRAFFPSQGAASIAERTQTNLTAAREIVKDASALQAQAKWLAAQAVQAHKERLSEASDYRLIDLAGSSVNRRPDAFISSERRYRRLFETARDGILILDSEFGRITDANPFMTELLGYSHDELIGKELWEIGLLQNKDASQEAFQRLKRENFIRYENLPLENRRGERREVEFVSNLYRENGHTVIQCNIRDITERRRVEDVLAAAAAKNERIAETLQRSMLQASPTGKFSGIAVQTLYEAALDEAAVGGDFFDAFALSRGRVALVVGDVSGKGLIAAGRTAEVKYALRAFLHEYQSPEIALGHLNDFICETHRHDADSGETFIVVALAVVDPATGQAVFSGAGAEASFVLRLGGMAEAVEAPGWPLGIYTNAVYVAKTLMLASGETVLMATDGITEARRGYAFLGTEGMAALAEQAGPAVSLTDLSQAIYGGARAFAGGLWRDDVCLLLARRSQPETPASG